MINKVTDEHVLAAYVDGSDLYEVAPGLRSQFRIFATSGSWPSEQVLVVDDRHPPDLANPDYLPDWDLGLNLGLGHVPNTPDWFASVEKVVELLRQLATETEREFVLFLCFRSIMWRQEHLAFVGAGPIDLALLREAILRLIRHSTPDVTGSLKREARP